MKSVKRIGLKESEWPRITWWSNNTACLLCLLHKQTSYKKKILAGIKEGVYKHTGSLYMATCHVLMILTRSRPKEHFPIDFPQPSSGLWCSSSLILLRQVKEIQDSVQALLLETFYSLWLKEPQKNCSPRHKCWKLRYRNPLETV